MTEQEVIANMEADELPTCQRCGLIFGVMRDFWSHQCDARPSFKRLTAINSDGSPADIVSTGHRTWQSSEAWEA